MSILHLAFCLFPLALHAEVIDRLLAIVSGELIMLSDVTFARDLGLMPGGGDGDVIAAVLAKLIDRALILTEVDRYAPPEPSADSVDREVQRVRGRFPSPQAFDAVLSRSGFDEQHLREILRQDLRILAYENERFIPPPASDEELARYYREHTETFSRDGRLPPFESVRPEIVRALTEERRHAMIVDWVAGLQRRAGIIDLYSPGR